METRGRQPIAQPVSAIAADRAHEVREQVSRKYEYVPPGQLPLEKKHPESYKIITELIEKRVKSKISV